MLAINPVPIRCIAPMDPEHKKKYVSCLGSQWLVSCLFLRPVELCKVMSYIT
jgi:hypothetical protein